MKFHELKQKRNTIATEMRAIHEKVGDGVMTEEQRGKWNEAKTEFDRLNEQIEREEEMRSLDQKFVDDKELEQRAQLPGNPEAEAIERRAAAFDRFLRCGFGELTAEERQAVKELRAQGTSPDEKGGYTVPTQMLNKVVDQMKAYGGIAGISQILPTSNGQDITWSTADGTAEEGELLGENTAASEQDVEFGTAILGAKKLSSKIIRVSNELLQDSGIDIESYLAARIAQRIGRGEAKYLVKGTGAGAPVQPKGLDASVTGTVESAAAISWTDINALKHAIDPAYRNSPKFRLAFNDSTLKSLTEMVDGNKRPLWLPEITGVAPATILGMQYAIDQAIDSAEVGKKFIFCGDFDRFIIRRVTYMTLKRLVERYAEFDQTAFLAFHRFDCCLEDTSAIKALVAKGAGE
ncbi:phage major capsid protein [Morganella psychrotolerans]|uniref:Phage capsid protein n=1 Tax=Morganella psychrotolerans TaxID=368603 RepID=A0A1B8HPS4_9GAMM|nr:phage major capsid protein [Morganella psychrotolerans]OBU11496.1 phage capsid protein [Morganella psychrotolerans]